MSISAVSGAAAVDLATERLVAVMKKTRDVDQQAADALVRLVTDVAQPAARPGRIDVYA